MMIAIVGPQGCGKGTQAKLLAEKYGWKHLSIGQVLRELVELRLPESARIAKYMQDGVLVPDEDILLAVKASVDDEDLKRGVVFDGTPRNRQQLELVESTLGESFQAAIFISISEAETLRRLDGRLVCQKCGANFNLATQKPKKEGVCDQCGGKLGRRDDETPEATKIRLQSYHQQTVPLLKIYRRRNILIEIDGERPIETIHREVVSRLEQSGLIK